MENLLEKFWFRLVLILLLSIFLTEIGSVESMASRIYNPDFRKEYTATAVISLVVVELVYFINSRLEVKVPLRGNIVYRLFLQAFFGWIAPTIVVYGLASFYFYLYGVDITRTDYVYYALPFAMLLLLFLNILLLLTPYILIAIRIIKSPPEVIFVDTAQNPPVPELRMAATPQSVVRIKIKDGLESAYLDLWEVDAAYIVNSQVLVRDKTGKEFFTDLSLDELETDFLPSASFFRINRQLIVSNSICESYKPLALGKLQVNLTIKVPVEPIVSQLKSHSYKYWIKNQG